VRTRRQRANPGESLKATNCNEPVASGVASGGTRSGYSITLAMRRHVRDVTPRALEAAAKACSAATRRIGTRDRTETFA
jgi:hypothetical protein